MTDDRANNSILEGSSEGEFGQEYSLVNALHKLVHDYPLGVGLFKEFIQNADDAKATVIRFVLDKNNYSDLPFHSPKLKVLAEPSLLVWNNAPFDPQDVANIQNLGDSHKVRKPTNTGKFGLGFNTCYNITDYPLLLTGDQLYLFDPHKSAYEYQNGSRPGYRWQITPQRWIDSPGLLNPFKQVGLSPTGPAFVGAAFRLPLRTRGGGKIKHDCVSPEKIEELLEEFIRFAPSILLFLKHLVRIEFLVVNHESDQPEPILTILTENEVDVLQGRSAINELIKSDLPATLAHLRSQEQSALQTCYQHFVSVTRSHQSAQSYRWLVSAGLFRGAADVLLKSAEELWDRKEKVLPWAGVAGLMPSPDAASPANDIPGEVFCFLPLPNVRGNCRLPVHLNGYFDVDTSRTGLTHEASAKESIERLRGRWNKELLIQAVAPAYAALLLEILKLSPAIEPESFYRLWLNPSQDFPPPLDALSRAFYSSLAGLKLIKSAAGSWMSRSDLRLADPVLLPPLVAEAWSKIPSPEIPEPILAGFACAEAPLQNLTTAELREFLKQETDVACLPEKASRPALQKREWLEALGSFVFKEAKETDFTGLPLLLLADGTLHTFGYQSGNVYLAGAAERNIFSECPGWFVDAAFAEFVSLKAIPQSKVICMAADQVLSHLAALLAKSGDHPYRNWDQAALSEVWLTSVFDYFLAQPVAWSPNAALLSGPCFIPDQNQRLWPCGNNLTPLLVPAGTDRRLRGALEFLNVPLVSGGAPLLKTTGEFATRFGKVWSLSQRDLADTLFETRAIWSLKLAKYNPAISDPILQFFASEESIQSFQIANDNRSEKIRHLPIFPCQDGSLIAPQDHSCFIVSSVIPPAVPLSAKLLQPGTWKPLLDALKIEALAAQAIIKNILLPGYAALGEADRLTALAWIRDHLESALTEAAEDREVFLTTLQSAKLVKGSDRDWHTCRNLYVPDNETINAVLGDQAITPDVALYESDWDRWLPFFERLGLNKSPQPQHLAIYLQTLAKTAPVTPSVEKSLTLILHHLVDHWSDLSSGSLSMADGSTKPFREFLREFAWCPPLRGDRNLRNYLVAAEPPFQLFPLVELFPPVHGHLVTGCQHLLPLSPEQRNFVPKSISDLVPEVKSPSSALVAEHFTKLLEFVQSQPTLDPKSLKTPLTRLYGFFGKLHRRSQPVAPVPEAAELDLEQPTIVEDLDFESIQQQFQSQPCIYVAVENKFRQPKDVFFESVDYASPWWAHCRPASDEIKSGLAFFGCKDRPEIADLCRLTHEIHAAHPEGLEKNEELQFIRILHRLADLLPASDPLPEICLLDRCGIPVRSSELFYHDASWLDEKLGDCPIHLHHPDLPTRLISRLNIRRLSKHIEAKPASAWAESQHPQFRSRCAGVEQLVHTPEFQAGLLRILRQKSLDQSSDQLSWLSDVKILPYESLECSHQIFDDDDVHVIGPIQELCFIDDWVLSFSEEADEVLFDQVAACLQRLIGLEVLADLSPLVKILQCPPDRIAAILDKLRIPRLFEAQKPAEAEGDSPEPDTEFFGDADPGDEPPETEDSAPEESSQTAPAKGGAGGHSSGTQSSGQANESGDDADDGEDENEESGGGSGKRSSSSGGRTSTAGWHRMPRTYGPRNRRPQSRSEPRGRLQSFAATAAQKQEKSFQGDLADDELPANRQIGDWGVHWVLQYERQHGRKPKSMAHNNPGYDVESQAGLRIRYIEVKSIAGPWDLSGVPVSPKQIEFAQEKKDQFWLYVVENALDADTVKIHPIQNPVGKINQYRFDNGWSSEVTAEQVFIAQKPKPGVRIKFFYQGNHVTGKISQVGEKLMQVLREDNGHQVAVANNPLDFEILPT